MSERKLIIYPGVDIARIPNINSYYEDNEHVECVGNASHAIIGNDENGYVIVYQTKTARVFRPETSE